jgi:hypothetical protein
VSGLNSTLGKCVYFNEYRRFESYHLRHKQALEHMLYLIVYNIFNKYKSVFFLKNGIIIFSKY